MQSNSEEEQQGFITTKLKALHSHVQNKISVKKNQLAMFSPYYLSGSGCTIKHQIPQCIQLISRFDINALSNQKTSSSPNPKTKSYPKSKQSSLLLDHPYRIYTQNSLFMLAYSRNSSQEPIYNEFQYIRNDIVLETSLGVDKEQTFNKRNLIKKDDQDKKLRNSYGRPLKPAPAINLTNNNDDSAIDIRISASSVETQKSNSNQMLQFDSKFQSGNLYCSYWRYMTNQYHLFLSNDTNSYGYNQWFYFSLQNVKSNVQYTFKIVNFKKKSSFFKYGYQPMIFSKRKYHQTGQNGWFRGGYNIQYTQSNITVSKFFKFYTLTFRLKFEYDNDYILIASNLPYSFSRLSKYLDKFSKDFKKSNSSQQISQCKISSLCRTFCGNNIAQIQLSPIQQYEAVRKHSINLLSPQRARVKKQKKKLILFLARQHPGQTVSSFLMQGVLNVLKSFGQQNTLKIQKTQEQNSKIVYLLKNFTILCYPMVNVDGVVYGNSRCDVSGMDLNRRWKNPSKIFHPQIAQLLKKIEQYQKKYEIAACLDLHGHSKAYNVFGYGCKVNTVSCRILSYLISKQTQKFHFPLCTFGISRYKASTARASIFRLLQNQNVLTIQSSYYGYYKSSQQMCNSLQSTQSQQKPKDQSLRGTCKTTKVIQYFQPQTWDQIALGILMGLQDFLNRDQTYKDVEKEITDNLKQILQYQKQQQDQQEGSGSESDPEADQIDFNIKIKTIFPKQFVEEAKCFDLKQQQEELSQKIDQINMQNSIQTFKYNSQQFCEAPMRQKEQQSLPKQQNNKIRIKSHVMRNKSGSNKIQSQLSSNGSSSLNKPKARIEEKKQSISYSMPKGKVFEKRRLSTSQKQQKFAKSHYSQKASTITDRLYTYSKAKLLFADPITPLTPQSLVSQPINSQPSLSSQQLCIQPSKSNQIYASQFHLSLLDKNCNPIPTEQFFLKFHKYTNKKDKLSSIQESIYKDDQREILSRLMENKRRIQIEKQTNNNHNNHHNTIERHNKIKNLNSGNNFLLTNKKDQLVDFKRFKDRKKHKLQQKYVTQTCVRYIQPYI